MPRKKPAPPRPANAGAGSAKKKPEVKLTDRQRLFCENLNRGMSNTEAAIKAGYSEKWARQQAGKLVDKTLHPHVVAYLDELREASRSKSVADGQEIRETLSGILRDEVEDVATGGKDLEYIKTPMPAAERIKAAQELARLDGLYAPTRVDLKVTEYSRDWLKEVLKVMARYVEPDTLRKIAGELPRFDP